MQSLIAASFLFPPRSTDLPSSPTLIIEALAENSVTPLTNPTLIHSSLIEYTHCAPTISIDTLSYMNYDTGKLFTFPWKITDSMSTRVN